MLTSSMVQINVTLPESTSRAIAPSDLIVMMTKDGALSFNGKKARAKDIRGMIQGAIGKMSNKENASVSIVAEVGVPWRKINDTMKIANSLGLKAHIATQPPK